MYIKPVAQILKTNVQLQFHQDYDDLLENTAWPILITCW